MHDYVVFFDLDHTLISANSNQFFVEQAYADGLLKKRDLARVFYLSLIYKLGFINPVRIINRMTLWLNGLPEKRIIELSGQVFEQSLKNAVRPAAVQEITKHKQQNGRIVLLSAATHYICALVRQWLDFDDVICSRMEVVDGRFTGKPLGTFCYGDEKRRRLQQYCAKNDHRLENAFLYADAYSDLPALEAVGRPVCVTPEARLLREARRRGWEICYW